MKTGISYFARSRLKHFREDMEEIKRNHCTYVVHTFSETDLEYYKGSIENLVRISHDVGLEVWLDPWGVGGIFGGESYSQFASLHLDVRQISSAGDSIPAACFNNPKFKIFMKEWVDSALQTGADNIFWDEPHFHIYRENVDEKIGSELWACRCKACKDLFKARYGCELPRKINKDVQEFKESSIEDFISEMSGYVKEKNGRVINSFCFLPSDGPIGGIRNWERFAAIDSLDIIGTDPYWETDKKVTGEIVAGRVSAFSRKIKALCDKFRKEPQIWILNFNIKSGTEDNIKVAVEAAYREGIRNLAAWSYYGTEMMASISSDTPLAVWKNLGEAYRELVTQQYAIK